MASSKESMQSEMVRVSRGKIHQRVNISRTLEKLIKKLQFHMIGDEATLATGKFDDQQKFIGVLLSNFEKNFYYGSTTLSQGIHKFQSDGQFTIFISGSFSNGSYGYTPAYNGIFTPAKELI